MSRNAYALDTLVDQVTADSPRAKVEYGEPDGLDVVRSVKFDRRTSRRIGPAITANLDPRIAELVDEDSGLTVVFQSGSPLADDRAPFSLVLGEQVEEQDAEVVTPD